MQSAAAAASNLLSVDNNGVGGSGRVGSWMLSSTVGRVGSKPQWVGLDRVKKM